LAHPGPSFLPRHFDFRFVVSSAMAVIIFYSKKGKTDQADKAAKIDRVSSTAESLQISKGNVKRRGNRSFIDVNTISLGFF